MDKYTAIGLIVSSVASISAAVTAILTRITYNENERGRNALVKPIFYIRVFSEDRKNKTVSLDIENVGYQNTLNGIIATWYKNDKIKVTSSEVYAKESNNKLMVKIDHSALENTENIDGYVVLEYRNIHGVSIKEAYRIQIHYEYHHFTRQNYPILTGKEERYFK